MRPFATAIAGAVLLGGHSLSTDYEPRTLRIESTAIFEMETTLFEMTVDGEPVEASFGGGSASEEARRVVRIDRFLESADGRPTLVRRTFETVETESIRSFGENTREESSQGPLAGLVLELSVHADGEVEVEILEGETPDDESLLEDLVLTLTLDAFLPAAEVDLGESWTLESDAIVHALGLAIDRKLFPEPERAEGGEGRGRRGRRGGGSAVRLFQQGGWDGQATLEATDEEHEGEPCAVIKIELECSGELPEPSFGGFGGRGRWFSPVFEPPFAVVESTFEVELEGRLIFSTESRRPIRLELEGDLFTERELERDREGATVVIRTAQDGIFALDVEIEEVAGA